MTLLRALVVDDEAPARADLSWLLDREDSVASVTVATDANEALMALHAEEVDVVFLDVRMPGLHGLDLARVLQRFAVPPQVVFVTAHEEHAVEAFELRACDYLLKPVRAERLHEALSRIHPRPTAPPPDPSTAPPGGAVAPDAGVAGGANSTVNGSGAAGVPDAAREAADPQPGGAGPAGAGSEQADDLAVLMVETAGRTRFVSRDDVRYAEASGDYTRLHTSGGTHLVRIPISTLEARWARAEFFRIHRSYLVALRAVTELRSATGAGSAVVVDGHELPVSRRHAREVKEALIRCRTGGRRP